FALLFPNAAIVLKRELLFIPVVGWAMARAGHIGVERGDGAKALRGLVRRTKAALADGRSILIFPEGTRTPVGSQTPYQVGTAARFPAYLGHEISLPRPLGAGGCRLGRHLVAGGARAGGVGARLRTVGRAVP